MNSKIKRKNKILSMFIVVFLVATVFFQSVSSEGFFSGFKQKAKDVVDNVKDKSKQVITNVKEKIINDEEKLELSSDRPILNKLKVNPIIKSILSYGFFKSNSALFMVYTKYGDFEKESSIGLGVPSLVDINNDGKNDVKAKVSLRLGIEKPFAISLKFNLQVTRLKGITDLDEHLEVSLQLRFPGFLDENLKGNKVRFGILSEKYEEIPDSCTITYKYVPYVFSKDKPVHSTVLDPGNIEGDDELNILFSYIDVTGVESENIDIFNVKLEPAVRAELTLSGFEKSRGRSFNLDTTSPTTAVVEYTRSANESTFNAGLIIYRLSSFRFDVELTPFKLGGGRIEYQRQSSKPVEVLLFFENTNNNSYFFAEDIPSHIKVSWNTAENNLIKVDTFGERCSSVGWRNALLEEDVTAEAYLSNLPSYIELNWIGKLAEGEIELSTDIGGCSAHVYVSEFGNDAFISADIYSTDGFDFSVFWDFSRQVFGISRSNMDLSFDISFCNLLNMNETADISFEVENEITSPFEFFLDDVLDYDAKIEFTGNNFVIKNVDVDIDVPSFGRFVLKMNSFEMTRESSVYFAFSVDENDDEINVHCDIHVSNGVKITGLIVGFNDFLIPVDDIVVNGEYDHTVDISITQGFLDFHFNEDGSGYIVLSGGLSIFVDSDLYNDYNILMGHVEGTVAFLSEDDSLNISWDASGALTIDGGGVVSLSGFNLWVKDKFDVSISAIVGSFSFNAQDDTGNLNLVLSKSTMTLVSDFSIKIEDFEEITVKADFSVDGSISLSGRLKISWGSEGVSFETVGVGVGINGDFTVSDLYFKFGDTIEFSSDRINLNGDLDIDVSVYLDSNGLSVKLDSDGASVSVSGFYVDAPGLIVASFSEFYLGGSGFINVGSYDGTVLLTADVAGYVRVMGLYIGSNGFGLPSPIQLSFKTDLSGAGQVVYLADGQELTVDVWGTKPVTVDDFYLNLNSGQILVSWDKLHIGLSAHSEIKISSGEVYLDASITSIDFDNFKVSVPTTEMNINGEMSLGYSGELRIKASIGSTVSINLVLESGSLDVNDLDIGVSGGGVSVDANWDNLHLEGAVDFDFTGSSSNGFTIGASGKGGISLNKLFIDGNMPYEEEGEYNPGNFEVEIGYFNLELDDVKASIIDIEIGETFSVNSASAHGSASEITIEDLYVSIDEFYAPVPVLVRIFELSVNFTGSGEFSFDLTEPDNEGIQTVNFKGSITDIGSIEIKAVKIYLIFIYFELEDFSIDGPTNFYITAKGLINFDASEKEILQNLSIEAGCDSTWTIGRLFIDTLFEIFDFNSKGRGDILFSGEIPGSIGDPSGTLLITISGEWSWSEFNVGSSVNYKTWEINKGIPIGAGSFNGDLTVSLGIDLLMAFLDPTIGFPSSSGVAINAHEESDINFLDFKVLRLANYIFNTSIPEPDINHESINFKKGRLQVTYDIDNNIDEMSIFADVESTMDVSLSLELNFGFLENTNYRLFLGGAELHPGVLTFNLDKNSADADYAHVKLESSSTFNPKIDLLKLKNINTNKVITFCNVVLSAPYIEIAYDINALPGGEDADKEGYVFVDTAGQQLSLEIYAFDTFYMGGCYFEADNWNVSWDFSSGWTNPFKWELTSDGYIDLYCDDAGIAFKFDGTWYTLIGAVDILEISAEILPQDPFTEGDNFQVHVTDPNSNNDISGATVTYEKKTGFLNWEPVETLTTDSSGYTSDFTAEVYDDSTTDCRIVVAHPDYNSFKVTFTVQPQGGTGEGYISGQVLDVSEFWDPLPGTTVSCSEDSDVSDSNGDYSLTVSPGVHTVTATYPGYETKTTTITVIDGQTSTYTFNMMPDNMGSLIGWVKIAGTNTGIADAMVTASPGGETVQTLMYGAQKGRFDMYLEPGQYDLTITKEGYEDSHVYDVNIYDDQETNIGDIELSPINEPPVAVLTITPTSARVGEIVNFDFSDSSDPDSDSLEYRLRWDSDTEPGNNEWSTDWFTDTSKTHIYDTAGTKTAWLQVKDSKEATDTTSVSIVINPVVWLSPNSDEYNLWWSDRSNAYDDDEGSSSYFGKPLDSGWCDSALVLKYNNPVDCDGFRIKAKNYDHLEKMKIVLYSSSNQKYSKEFSIWEYHVSWTYQEISDLLNIDRVEISFKLEDGYKFGSHYAHVYEFDLREI